MIAHVIDEFCPRARRRIVAAINLCSEVDVVCGQAQMCCGGMCQRLSRGAAAAGSGCCAERDRKRGERRVCGSTAAP
ncbi:hypothetical protein BRM42_12950, partial [Xanthomonas oryzae pv. oryzae]